MDGHLKHLLDAGVVAARAHPDLARKLNAHLYRGDVVAVLPGVYCLPERAGDAGIRLAAIRAKGEKFIVTRDAAASLWWDEPLTGDIVVASEFKTAPQPGFRFEQRYVKPELVRTREGLLVTSPALTIIDRIPDIGPSSVDDGLRRRIVTLRDLEDAMRRTSRRPGNAIRREVLRDSRDQPWSHLERQAHRELRKARITGWKSNYRVFVEGVEYYIDIALPELMLGLEIDGFETHGPRPAFQRDRARDIALAEQGWRIIRFSSDNLWKLPRVLPKLMDQQRRRRG